jgi:hypothetical protein
MKYNKRHGIWSTSHIDLTHPHITRIQLQDTK